MFTINSEIYLDRKKLKNRYIYVIKVNKQTQKVYVVHTILHTLSFWITPG